MTSEPAQSQLLLGQYEDEAPFRTWNSIGVMTASSLALGGTHFAYSQNCSVSLSNPSLLNKLPKVLFALSGSTNSASFSKFSIVNTGVFQSIENLSGNFLALDFAGVSFNFRGWGIAFSSSLFENFTRPNAEHESLQENQLYYSLNFAQKGTLRNINFSLSRELHHRISVGIGFNFISGNSEKNIEEKKMASDITISDSKSHEFRGFFLNGGFFVDLTDKLTVAAMIRAPYKKKSESTSLLRYLSPQGNTDIQIEASADNIYNQPLMAGIGFNINLSNKIRLASDFSYFNWGKYKVHYFDEDLKRNFKDTIKISTGMEYIHSQIIFRQNTKISYRAGFGYDPQPMKEPHSYYLYYSIGLGIQWEKITLDFGALIGNENGSGDNLNSRVIAFTVGYK